jgi:hypothetical protein
MIVFLIELRREKPYIRVNLVVYEILSFAYRADPFAVMLKCMVNIGINNIEVSFSRQEFCPCFIVQHCLRMVYLNCFS